MKRKIKGDTGWAKWLLSKAIESYSKNSNKKTIIL
jgi:hypothetical protein